LREYTTITGPFYIHTLYIVAFLYMSNFWV
jgi:hypothetical protein